MQTIEEKMIKAIRDNVTDKKIGNTRVHAIIGGHEVQLHGNIIAHVDASRRSVRFTLAGWPTPTTRSRINALLREFANKPDRYCSVSQHKGAQYFSQWAPGETDRHSVQIDSDEWVQA